MKPKITKKYLTDWMNKQMKTLLVPLVVTGIKSTNTKNSQDFTARLVIYVKDTTLNPRSHYLYCFYSIKELQDHVDGGYELYWKTKQGNFIIEQTEIDLRRKSAPEPERN